MDVPSWLQFLFPPGRSILTYLRDYDGETILCLANLSDQPHVVSPKLHRFVRSRPVDLVHDRPFNPIDERPYPIHLEPYEFAWLAMTPVSAIEEVRYEPMTVIDWDAEVAAVG